MITFDNLNKLPTSAGIYSITNKENGHKYIGQSNNIRRRFQSYHKSEFKNPNSSMYNSTIYKAMRKYGLDSFIIEVIEECEINKLNEREVYWITKFDTYKNGYNSSAGGDSLPENMHTDEMENKRRETRIKNGSLKGDKHPRAKLLKEEVIEIRNRYINGESCEDIHKDYKDLYDIFTFKRIIFGKSYKDIGNIPPKEVIRKTNKGKHTGKIPDNTIIEIRNKYKSGKYSLSMLSKKYNISVATVHRIVTRLSYKHI